MLHALVFVQNYFIDVKERFREDRGATAVEYGLMVGLIAAVLITALLLLGPNLARIFTGLNTRLTAVTP